MANKPDIQYISRYFVPGSDAPEIAPKEVRKPTKTTLPKQWRREKVRIYVDPVALASVVVAVAILVTMVVSIAQFSRSWTAYQTMESYLTTLRDENVTLEHTYRTGYDLETVEEQALALGMVPVSQVQTISVPVTVPTPEPEPTVWDNIVWFLKGLFA